MTKIAQLSLILAGLSLVAGCGDTEPPAPGPVVLLGVDGGSWNAIRELWDRGQLPHLRSLAERGVTAELQPGATASPVIWTSIATGVRPSRHGIQGFTVRTDSGEVPVSSVDRRVPALWNMASTEGLRVALLGWWASWPAEAVDGVVVTDRILRREEGRFYPPDLDPDLLADGSSSEPAGETDVELVARKDRLMASIASQLASEGFDLLMLYLRDVDVQSHHHWKYFRPRGLQEEVNEASLETFDVRRIPDAYDRVDNTLGELVARAPESTNFFVLSDHGFQAAKGERYRIQLHLDRILEHLGFLVRDGGKIDPDRSVARTWNSPPFTRTKLIRFRPFERPTDEDLGDPGSTRRRLEADLGRITYEDGSPVFRFRDLEAKERSRGGDMVVIVRFQGVSPALYLDGEPIPGAIGQIEEISGTHSKSTEGIFIAAGPDIDSGAELVKIHSLDITPTLLFALGLPVAEDFDGRARTEMFRAEFRRRFPLRTIDSWGELEARESPESQSDEELLEELRALGYLD